MGGRGRLPLYPAGAPITRLCFGGIEGEWTNADFRDGGVASDVVTPLMWSLYEFIWDRAINGFLKDLRLSAGDFPAARVFYGRPYWNLAAVKQCARKLPGFVESEFDRDIGARPRDAGDDFRTATNFWNILRALPVVVSAAGAMKEQEARDRELLSSDWPRRFEADLRLMDDDGLLRHFKQLVEGAYRVVEENYFRTIFCVSLAKLDFKAVMGDLPVSYPALVSGLDSLSHFEMRKPSGTWRTRPPPRVVRSRMRTSAHPWTGSSRGTVITAVASWISASRAGARMPRSSPIWRGRWSGRKAPRRPTAASAGCMPKSSSGPDNCSPRGGGSGSRRN